MSLRIAAVLQSYASSSDAIGRTLLNHVGYSMVFAVTVFGLAAIAVASRCWRRKWLSLEELVHTLEAFGLLWMAGAVFIVFGMTNPPAASELPYEMRGAIAIILPIMSARIAIVRIKRSVVMSHRRPRPAKRASSVFSESDKARAKLRPTKTMADDGSPHSPAA